MKKKKVFKFIDLFAGIGGFRSAIELFGNDVGINTKCVGFSEIDKYATMSYKANYDTKNEIEMGDIVEFVENNNLGLIEDIDLLCGGFPCQPFSMMGKQLGLNDHRGGLYSSVIEIIKIKNPKYVLLENVRNLYTHEKGDTYKTIKNKLTTEGYNVYEDIFNTSDYGLPQHRRRLYIFAIRKDLDNGIIFNSIAIKQYYQNYIKNLKISINNYETVIDGVLEMGLVDEKYYLSDKIKPTILSNGSKNFKSKSAINQLIARPLTATMVKLHRACQDNYYSKEFLLSECKDTYLNLNISKEDEANHKIRKLTPWEALKLQGFDKKFFDNCVKAGVSEHQIYKQAGNAISVNTLYSILRYLNNFNYIK